MINMQDKTLTCRDCGREFVFTVREQEFYAEKQFANPPSRCPECRAARKAKQVEDGTATFAPRPEREMFPAVCSTCGKDTQVPFQPRPGRPVYCYSCYLSQRTSAPAGFDRGGNGNR